MVDERKTRDGETTPTQHENGNGDVKDAAKKKGGVGKNKKEEDKVVELSEEDAQLKENLELMVTRLADPDQGVVNLALITLMYEDLDVARISIVCFKSAVPGSPKGVISNVELNATMIVPLN